MTSPANGQSTSVPNRPSISTAQPSRNSTAFGASTPPDHRTTALQSAVAILRGSSPKPKTEEILDMAEAFHTFLKRR